MPPPRPYWTGTLARQGEAFVWEMQDAWGWVTTGTCRAELQPDGSKVWRMEGHIGPAPECLTKRNGCAKESGSGAALQAPAPEPDHEPAGEVSNG